MRHALAALLLAGPMIACAAGTDPGFGPPGSIWHLSAIDGTPFPARATLAVSADGQLSGQAPCNGYAGGSAVYPVLQADRLRVTRRACPELDAETAFFRALAAMTRASRNGDTLTLTGANRSMVFTTSG